MSPPIHSTVKRYKWISRSFPRLIEPPSLGYIMHMAIQRNKIPKKVTHRNAPSLAVHNLLKSQSMYPTTCVIYILPNGAFKLINWEEHYLDQPSIGIVPTRRYFTISSNPRSGLINLLTTRPCLRWLLTREWGVHMRETLQLTCGLPLFLKNTP